MFLQTGGPIRNQSKEADPGAALEAIVARKLISLELINPTTRCIQKQDQDTAAITRLDPTLKQKFEKAGMLIAKLILKRFIFDDAFDSMHLIQGYLDLETEGGQEFQENLSLAKIDDNFAFHDLALSPEEKKNFNNLGPISQEETEKTDWDLFMDDLNS